MMTQDEIIQKQAEEIWLLKAEKDKMYQAGFADCQSQWLPTFQAYESLRTKFNGLVGELKSRNKTPLGNIIDTELDSILAKYTEE